MSMAGLYEQFLAGWRAAIAAAWPEVVTNGIWDPGDPARLPYDEATQILRLPFAALAVDALTPSNDWGADNRVWEPVVDVWYVDEFPVGNGAGLRLKLETLADYLETNELPLGQIIPPEPEISTSDLLAPNSLLMMLNATQRAGRLRATCLIGVTRG